MITRVLFEPSNMEGRNFAANRFELISQYDIRIVCDDYDMIMNPDHTAFVVVARNFIILNVEEFFNFFVSFFYTLYASDYFLNNIYIKYYMYVIIFVLFSLNVCKGLYLNFTLNLKIHWTDPAFAFAGGNLFLLFFTMQAVVALCI